MFRLFQIFDHPIPTKTGRMPESLLEKYRHLKLLTKLKKLPPTEENDNTLPSLPFSWRISILVPGVGARLQLQVEEAVAAKQQLDQLKMWLILANSLSTVSRSTGDT
jgi:hypothetical protein